MYQAPRGDYHVFEDSGGGQWYAIPGTAAVERRPVYEDGKPVYDKDVLRTVNVETVRYPTTPTPVSYTHLAKAPFVPASAIRMVWCSGPNCRPMKIMY